MQQQHDHAEQVRLLQRYLAKTATEEELSRLQALLANEETARSLAAISGEMDLVPVTGTRLSEGQSDVMLEAMLQSINGQQAIAADIAAEVVPMPARSRTNRLGYWMAAASVLFLLGSGLYFYVFNKKPAAPVPVAATDEILPGRQGALLTLADGSLVSLDTLKNGSIALQGGVMARLVNGALYYEGKGDRVVYNTMSTPRGRQFQLTLPDGTKVWLNASSSIRYPNLFTGGERKVTVTGESYFEVAHNPDMPFVVNVQDKAEVSGQGTHFNVNGYGDEGGLSATLLKGMLRVKAAGQSVTLQPGQQATLDQQLKVEQEVDLEKVMAWKNGLFNFNGSKLEVVMKQLERWYAIEVVYEKGIPDITVGGEMSKDISLNGLMVVLEKLDVHYRIEGRRLTILP
ncbi:MAG: DUF4974 domain-containing protein [Candidatus Pseudobacter hemicellulosilyticus]|uniref:DUF4974 domain-containing protein n=1 Tax=Candidatus Pseudobacter hemicellulosilyticus TaxID=3121375 RepID=A0AAJ5WW96_9BACT|nr:MAG: DUF4974 domain-containing protein [Pseudobacter sp.]